MFRHNGGTLHIDYWKINDGDEWQVTATVEGMQVDSNEAIYTENTKVELLELSEV